MKLWKSKCLRWEPLLYHIPVVRFQDLGLVPVSHSELPSLPGSISFPFQSPCFPRIVLGLLFFTPPLPGLSQRPTTIWRSSYPPARTLHQKAQSWHLTLNTVCVLKRCEDGALWALERSECDLQSGKGTLCPAPLREHKLCGNDFSTTSRTRKCYIYVVCCQ